MNRSGRRCRNVSRNEALAHFNLISGSHRDVTRAAGQLGFNNHIRTGTLGVDQNTAASVSTDSS